MYEDEHLEMAYEDRFVSDLDNDDVSGLEDGDEMTDEMAEEEKIAAIAEFLEHVDNHGWTNFEGETGYVTLAKEILARIGERAFSIPTPKVN